MRKALWIAVVLAGCDDPCPDRYDFNEHFDSCYRLVDNGSETWDSAESVCERSTFDGIPAHLAVIESDAERDMMNRAFSDSSGGYWVGGSDQAVEGQFRWVTGEPVTRSDWGPGEPNNDFGTENCMEYRVGITDLLNDRTCTNFLDFACEWDGVAPE